MNISINAEKTFDEMQHGFMTNVLKRLGVKETYLNMTEAIAHKPTANIILNEGKAEVIPLQSEIRWDYPLSLLLFNTALPALAGEGKQEEKTKGEQVRKQHAKSSQLADDILQRRDPKIPLKELFQK